MLLLTKRLVTPKLITREGTSAAAIPSVSCERIDFGFKEFIRRESWDRCAELSMRGKLFGIKRLNAIQENGSKSRGVRGRKNELLNVP